MGGRTRREGARAASVSAPVAQGTLGQYPLPTLLFYLFKKRFSGTLVLAGDPTGRVFLREGFPVEAEHPSMPYASLARVMLERGQLDDAGYQQALVHMAQTGMSEPDALRMVARATETQLAEAHQVLLRRKLNLFFKGTQASFELYAEEPGLALADGDATRRIHPRRVIYQGIRNNYDEERLTRETGEAIGAKAIRVPTDRAQALDDYGFGEDERALLVALREMPRTLEELAEDTGRGELEVRQLAYALLATELLELHEAVARRKPLVTPVSAAAKVPAGPRPDVATAPAGVPRPATPGGAPRPGAPRPAAPATSPGMPAMRPPASGSRPAAATTRPGDRGAELRVKIEAKAKTFETENLFQLLGLPETASKADAKKAYIEAAKVFHPDRLGQFGLDDLRSIVEQIFARINEANTTLGDDAKRTQYLELLKQGGTEKITAAQETELRQALDAELEFQKGELFLKQRQYAKAEEHLKRACDASPDLEHQVAYAWARYNNPANDRAAIAPKVKETLTRAAKERPSLARVHLYMGEIFLNEELPGNAERAFQEALRFQPDNVDALRGIRLAQSRKGKGKDKDKDKDKGDASESKLPFAGLFGKKKDKK